MKTKTAAISLCLIMIMAFTVQLSLAEKPKPNQTKCPVMGGDINKECFVDYQGKRIYFCCPGCDKKFMKSPEKYLEKMKKEGVILEDTPKKK